MWEITKTNSVLYTIQVKDSSGNTAPKICRREKIDGKTVLTPVDWLKWWFEKIELSTYHSDELNKDLENINLYLFDEDGDYKLSTAWTALWRNMINSLAGEKTLGELTIQVWSTQKNWQTYANIYIRNNGELTNWKLQWDDQKKLIDQIKNKKWEVTGNDYSELEEKMKSFIPEINKKSEKLRPDVATKKFEEATKEDEETPELPF